jgi:predicted ATP-grasp superfamily ATP-dependent carboligase
MRLLIYEHLTASAGCGPELPQSLAIEGWAMLSALLEDCRCLANVEPHTLVGPTFQAEIAATAHRVDPARGWLDCFTELVQRVDAALIIAPEFERMLESLVTVAEVNKKQIFGCSSPSIALTADKWACGRHLHAHGIPTPTCQLLRQDLLGTLERHPIWPVVLKPRDGAGSIATILIPKAGSAEKALASVRPENPGEDWIIQPFVPGQPASVACIVHKDGVQALPATSQQLSSDGRFRYRGGHLPLDEPFQTRAQTITRRAVSAIEGLKGYVGVDLVLGAAEDGADDFVIEINPRITTSYLGLKALCRQNLLQALLAACAAQPPERLTWKPGSIAFRADGATFLSSGQE